MQTRTRLREWTPLPAAQLEPVMTVNRVVREFPNARVALERLHIDVSCEGSRCLDEVAWFHGMDSRELLQALERAIAG